jgi:hypothetical protein
VASHGDWRLTVRYVGRWSLPPPPSHGANNVLGVLSSPVVALPIGGHGQADLAELLLEVAARGERQHQRPSRWWVEVVVHGDNNSSASVWATTAASMASLVGD